MTCHFEKWWKHCILTGPIFSFFWSQLCAKCDLNSQGVVFSLKVFLPNNLLFISVIRVYHPAGFFSFFFFPSLYCGLFLQSIEIFLPSYINKRHLPKLVADPAACLYCPEGGSSSLGQRLWYIHRSSRLPTYSSLAAEQGALHCLRHFHSSTW